MVIFTSSILIIFKDFLDVSMHLYRRLCLSVRLLVRGSVGHAFLKYCGNRLLRPINYHGTHIITFIHSFIHSFGRIVARTELVFDSPKAHISKISKNDQNLTNWLYFTCPIQWKYFHFSILHARFNGNIFISLSLADFI